MCVYEEDTNLDPFMIGFTWCKSAENLTSVARTLIKKSITTRAWWLTSYASSASVV